MLMDIIQTMEKMMMMMMMTSWIDWLKNKYKNSLFLLPRWLSLDFVVAVGTEKWAWNEGTPGSNWSNKLKSSWPLDKSGVLEFVNCIDVLRLSISSNCKAPWNMNWKRV